MSAERALLGQRLQILIRSTVWAAEKQNQWLQARGLNNWQQCDETQLREAVEYLEKFDQMFDKELDYVPPRHNNRMDAEEKESLRIYLGEFEE